MTHPVTLASRQLALDLHAVLSSMDSARWRPEAIDSTRRSLESIQRRTAELVEGPWPESARTLRSRLAELAHVLETRLPTECGDAGEERWSAFRQGMLPAYEAIQGALRELETDVPSLRPTNYGRSLFHASSALLAIVVLDSLPDPSWAIAIAVPFALLCWLLEGLRRVHGPMNARLMRVFGPIAHPHETHRTNSATWFATALALMSFTLSPLPCTIGLVTLGVGDPVAGIVGRRFGRIRITHGRTLEGTLAFAVSAALAAVPVLLLTFPEFGWQSSCALASAGAVAGAAMELVSQRIDDNLSVPLAAAGGGALACLWMGVPL